MTTDKDRLEALVKQLADLFDWQDRSYLHATLHVESAVKSLRAELEVAKSFHDVAVKERDLYKTRLAHAEADAEQAIHYTAQELDDLKDAIWKHIPYHYDDGTDDEASVTECLEYAAGDIKRLAHERDEARAEATRAKLEHAEALAVWEDQAAKTREAITRARREGAEAMREAAAQELDRLLTEKKATAIWVSPDEIRALPLPGDEKMTCNRCKSGAGPFIDGICAYCHIKAARREGAEAMREAETHIRDARRWLGQANVRRAANETLGVEVVAATLAGLDRALDEIRALPLPGDEP